MKVNTNISGFVLAGGKSQRMGTDKALLDFQGKPLFHHMVSLIRPFCGEVFISGQNQNYVIADLRLIPDLYTNCGPIAGIYSSLRHSSTEWNLLVSVDVPFVNQELFQFLISNIGDFDCIIPEHQNGKEPLVGLYRKCMAPIAKEMIEKGEYKLTTLLSGVNTLYLDCNFLIEKYPRLFLNINRPEDYQSI